MNKCNDFAFGNCIKFVSTQWNYSQQFWYDSDLAIEKILREDFKEID